MGCWLGLLGGEQGISKEYVYLSFQGVNGGKSKGWLGLGLCFFFGFLGEGVERIVIKQELLAVEGRTTCYGR